MITLNNVLNICLVCAIAFGIESTESSKASTKSSKSTSKLDLKACKELGFKREELMCSSCNYLSKFKLDELKSNCLKCCLDDTKNEKQKYSKAVLEYCEWNLGRFPQLKEFIEKYSKRARFSKLKLRTVPGQLPMLILYDKKGHEEKRLGVDKWNTDTLKEYLTEVLS